MCTSLRSDGWKRTVTHSLATSLFIFSRPQPSPATATTVYTHFIEIHELVLGHLEKFIVEFLDSNHSSPQRGFICLSGGACVEAGAPLRVLLPQ